LLWTFHSSVVSLLQMPSYASGADSPLERLLIETDVPLAPVRTAATQSRLSPPKLREERVYLREFGATSGSLRFAYGTGASSGQSVSINSARAELSAPFA